MTYKHVFIGAFPDEQFRREFGQFRTDRRGWPISWFREDDLIIVFISPWHVGEDRLDNLKAELKRLAKPLDGFSLTFDTLVPGPDPLKPEILEAQADPPAMLRVFQEYFTRHFGWEDQRADIIPYLNLGKIEDETFIFGELAAELHTHVPELVLFESIYQNETDGFAVIERFNLGD